MVCLRNKRNSLKIRSLAFQTKPCNPAFVLKSYLDATKPKATIKTEEHYTTYAYGYLIFDFVVTGKYFLFLLVIIYIFK